MGDGFFAFLVLVAMFSWFVLLPTIGALYLLGYLT